MPITDELAPQANPLKRKPKPKAPMSEQVEAPARIRPGHVKDRTLSAVAGTATGYRNVDWPVEIAHEAGRLQTEERWLAIREYRDLVDVAEIRSGRDSTQLDVVKSGGGFPVTQSKADAIRQIVSIDSFMPLKDRTIIRKLCEGWSLPGAVRHACGEDFTYAVAARVRDALDALMGAMERAKRCGYRFDARVR